MKIFKRMIFVALICVVFGVTNRIFQHKYLRNKPMLDFFYGDGNDYDVLAFGPSYMFCTFNPVELYRTYGLLSFVPGTSLQPIEVTYHYLKKALDIYRPRVVLVGADMFVISRDRYLLKDGNAHAAVDCFPTGLDYVRLVFDLNVSSQYDEFLFPLIKYHQRWKSLGCNDFCLISQPYHDDLTKRLLIKGHMAYFISKASGNVKQVDMTKEVRAPVCDDYLRYLDEIHKLCLLQGCDLVLLASARSDALADGRLASFQDYAKSKGIAFLNLVECFDETGISNETDFYDTGHLNCFGAEKATRYIGKWLTEHYSFNTNMTAECRAMWDAEAKRYDEVKDLAIKALRKKQEK